MKFSIGLLALLVISCSTPKYTYYFNEPTAGATGPVLPLKGEALTASNNQAPIPPYSEHPENAQELKTLVAKTDVEPVLRKANRKQARQELRSVLREFKKSVKEPVSDNQEAHNRAARSNNGFAIAGFVLSILSWFVLWPLAILGIVFSAIGLNSEKKGLAIAGLIIGIVGILLLLIASQNGSIV